MTTERVSASSSPEPHPITKRVPSHRNSPFLPVRWERDSVRAALFISLLNASGPDELVQSHREYQELHANAAGGTTRYSAKLSRPIVQSLQASCLQELPRDP